MMWSVETLKKIVDFLERNEIEEIKFLDIERDRIAYVKKDGCGCWRYISSILKNIPWQFLKKNVIINISREREVMTMYLVQLGKEFVLLVDTIVEGMKVAVGAFKSGWEVDVVNIITGEVMVSLRDGVVPYFSTSIHEVL